MEIGVRNQKNKDFDKPGIDIFIVIYTSDGRPVEAAYLLKEG
jgi:hypothetical protein